MGNGSVNVCHISDYKPNVLEWENFMSSIYSANKYQSESVDDGIKIHLGYCNGDRTVAPYYKLGMQDDVHMLINGGSGSGKSVLVNSIIATLTWLYAPNDLQLELIDLKGCEFKLFIDKKLPHVRSCKCIGYDVTIPHNLLSGLVDTINDRIRLFQNNDCKNIDEYNKSNSENRVSKIVVVCDEYQRLFEDYEARSYVLGDLLKIIKYGRAAGVHLIFSSQSCGKNMDKDILAGFSLRCALRCDVDVSEATLGSAHAIYIVEKSGWLWAKSNRIDESLMYFKTPFISDEVLLKYLERYSIK